MDILRLLLIVVGVLILAGIYFWGKGKRARNTTDDTSDQFVSHHYGRFPEDDWQQPDRSATTGDASIAEELSLLGGMISEDRNPSITGTRQWPDNTPPPALHSANVPGASERSVPPIGQQHDEAPLSLSTDHREVSQPVHIGTSRVAVPPLIVVLNVMAPAAQPFPGMQLLDAFSAAGLEWGEMRIFHRRLPGIGMPIFSIASMMEPGDFDLDRMHTFATPGLTIFMQLPTPARPLDSYEDMLNTGRTLAFTLGGELCDEKRRPLTLGSITNTREKLLAYPS